jgi:arginase
MSSWRAARPPISIVWAPTALGLSPNPLSPSHSRGTWRAPAELRRAGLQSALGNPPEHELTAVADYDTRRSPSTGQRNEAALAKQTRGLAELLGEIIAEAHWPLVVGGDCSLLTGAGLAMRRLGRTGLVFVDGHLDFRHLGNSARLSAAAGEDLAAATGRGLPAYADVDGLAPYFRDEDVIALGERDGHPDAADIEQTAITVLDPELAPPGLSERLVGLIARCVSRQGDR